MKKIKGELHENMINIKQLRVGSFISLDQFTSKLDTYLPRFLEHEYNIIEENMKSHEIRNDGAKVVAEDILNRTFINAFRILYRVFLLF
ncbi:hypothetical protein LCGC14_2147080 [marine sediment metagenome]|uniref:Uncharacterized protein n=1 Tax=marine sediment metagenome TaxID=412755 RepID=A0A0F9DWJ9_9ZZZZ|nr:hypothetical protein [archaeon]